MFVTLCYKVSSPCRMRSLPTNMQILTKNLMSIWYDTVDGYYVAYKPITLPCISFMLIEMEFSNCYSCAMFVINSMSICND